MDLAKRVLRMTAFHMHRILGEKYLWLYYRNGRRIQRGEPRALWPLFATYLVFAANCLMRLIQYLFFFTTLYKSLWFKFVTLDFPEEIQGIPLFYLQIVAFWGLGVKAYHLVFVQVFAYGSDRLVLMLLKERDAVLLGGARASVLKMYTVMMFYILFVPGIALIVGGCLGYYILGLLRFLWLGGDWLVLGLLLYHISIFIQCASVILIFFIGCHSISLLLTFLIFLAIRIRQQSLYIRHDCARCQLPFRLLRYRRLNYRTFKYMQNINNTIGPAFTMVLAVCCPMNAMIVITLLPSSHNRSTPFLLALAIMQFGIIFLVHFPLAMFSQKFHRPFRLFHAQYLSMTNCPIRVRIILADTMLAFHTRRRYGFTYGSYGLITIFAFTKFVFIYSKFLMFYFKNISVAPAASSPPMKTGPLDDY